jgi:hypothetical protein
MKRGAPNRIAMLQKSVSGSIFCLNYSEYIVVECCGNPHFSES